MECTWCNNHGPLENHLGDGRVLCGYCVRKYVGILSAFLGIELGWASDGVIVPFEEVRRLVDSATRDNLVKERVIKIPLKDYEGIGICD